LTAKILPEMTSSVLSRTLNLTIHIRISAKFQRHHPQRRRQIKVRKVHTGTFRPISCYISETVQDRDLLSTEG